MKRIVVELNEKSIKNAVRQLKDLEKTVASMTREFYLEVAYWLVDKANFYIDNSEIGSLVKEKLKSSWNYERTDNGITITNNAQKEGKAIGDVPLAVLVEFGVGIVGQNDPHPNANIEGYEYNVPTEYKSSDGTWYFWTNRNELDLPWSAMVDYGSYDDHRGAKGKRLIFGTKGAKGVWYAFNAIADANTELSKPNGGEIGTIWENIKKRYARYL